MATSRSISQPLADDAPNGTLGPLNVVNAECDTIAIAEIEFGEITVKVFLADVLINAVDATLQDREVIFGSIGRGVAANVFVLRMVHGAVTNRSPAFQ